LFEIEENLLNRIGRLEEELIEETKKYINRNDNTFFSREEIFNEGDTVCHPVFGHGVIEKIDKDNGAYIIRFENIKTPRSISFTYKGLRYINSTVTSSNS